jgi:RNA polymerase sigma factor (sigma-70 family)
MTAVTASERDAHRVGLFFTPVPRFFFRDHLPMSQPSPPPSEQRWATLWLTLRRNVSLLRGFHLVEDAVQQAIADYLEMGHDVNNPDQDKIQKIALNRLFALRRRDSKDAGRVRPLDTSPPPSDNSFFDRIATRDLLDAMKACLEHLEDRPRSIIRMRFFEELTYETIAQRMGLSVTAVYNAAGAAVRRLSDCLPTQEPDT